jgi:type IV pilus assembly protein PilM
MLGFMQNWFAAKANPIGVDFGSDCLRLAQVQVMDKEHRLIAAACADVPSHIRNDPAQRLQFFIDTTRDLLAQGNFRGREAILALPISSMYIQHLRMPRMDDAETKKALPWEARGKLPFDPNAMILRHVIAGEVYQDSEAKHEVVVMAAAKELVNQLLNSAARAKLDIVGMNVEPKAMVDCFQHIYRRKTDASATSCFVDIGSAASRAVIARGGKILFARIVPIGGNHLNRAVANALHLSVEEAKLLRIQLGAKTAEPEDPQTKRNLNETAVSEDNSFAVLPQEEQRTDNLAVATRQTATPQMEHVEQACREPVSRLVEELDMCRRYYETTFPNAPVDRLIFIGGEARQRVLCQTIAQELGLAAQIGDPLVRMGRVSDVGFESGIDRRQPQPGWAVAIGLSMGPAAETTNS